MPLDQRADTGHKLLSVPVEWYEHKTAESGMGGRHHLCSSPKEVLDNEASWITLLEALEIS